LRISTGDVNTSDPVEVSAESSEGVHKRTVASLNDFLISLSDLSVVSNTFQQFFLKSRMRLTRYADTEDPETCMWNFCHYLFIPTRINDSTIPNSIKILSLRCWLATIMVLPLTQEFTNRFISIGEGIPEYQNQCGTVIEQRVDRIVECIDPQFIRETIASTSNKSNSMQVFIRTFASLALTASLEILEKWCPNIVECTRLNPGYDGKWLKAFDPLRVEQVKHINEMRK
jgi:hypothetical protein